ncbi:MAG: ABC transporter permease [Acidobacteriota bacterium]|nr:ABC transporter permease [Acidobacteriota bacterium]
MRLLLAFLRRDFADDMSYRLTFLIEVLDALVLLAAVALLSRGLGPSGIAGYAAFPFLFVGLTVNAALSVCLACFTLAVRGSRAEGMLRVALLTPTPPWAQVMGSAAYPFLRGFADAALHLSAAVLLGLSLSSANLAGALAVFLLGLAAASAVGIASAAFAIVFKRGDPLLWLIGVVSMVLGGVFYPVDQLPAALRAIGWATPVAPALAAMRPLLLDGASLAAVWPAVAALAAYAAVGIPLSLILFNAAVRHARRRGTIKET